MCSSKPLHQKMAPHNFLWLFSVTFIITDMAMKFVLFTNRNAIAHGKLHVSEHYSVLQSVHHQGKGTHAQKMMSCSGEISCKCHSKGGVQEYVSYEQCL